jgi:hypothetical protein
MSPYSAQAIPNSGVPNGHILESLFPKPKPVIGRHFAYAFASNGWKKDSICIGGAAPNLKQQIKTGVVSAVSG